jgi:hypothetical protein
MSRKIIGRGAEQAATIGDLAGHKPGVRQGAQPDGKVVPLADQIDKTIDRIGLDRDAGVLGQKFGDDRAEPPPPEAARQADAEMTIRLPVSKRRGLPVSGFKVQKDGADAREIGLPRLGEFHTARGPLRRVARQGALRAT